MAKRPAGPEDMLARVALGVRHAGVLAAMRAVPREKFVPDSQQRLAYADRALPIEAGQTISQPLMVALMLEAIDPRPEHRVLEIGTGSGYVAALLGKLVALVITIERHAELADSARQRLEALGCGNVTVVEGDGSAGWPDEAPYDGIVVSASGPQVPEPLKQQLAIGGRLVMPVGRSEATQQLIRVTRRAAETFETENLGPVQFVPLIGSHGWPETPGHS